MVLDHMDTEALRLAGRYRWLPYGSLGKYGFDGLDDEIDKLVKLGLIAVSRNKEYMRLSANGYSLLAGIGYRYNLGSKRAFAGSPSLRRRLQTSDIMLTCLRAGIDTLRDEIDALREQPVFFPAFELRPAMMNCANCSGFGHWGDAAYMIQYLSPASPGMYRVSEFATFYNLSSIFRANRDEPMAMLLAGESYAGMWKLLTSTTLSPRHGSNGFADFSDLYKKLDIPIYLTACGETGARQLAVMCQPDYRAKIARSAYGQRWVERDPRIPEADGCVDGVPLVIAVDMELRRIEAVVSAARAQGRGEVRVAAFEEQIRELLYPLYPRGKPGNIVSLFKIEEPILNAAFSRIGLYSMDRAPAYSDEGGAVHA